MNELCWSLNSKEFEVGIALPIANATKENSLDIKIMNENESYSNMDEILFVLKVLEITFKKSSDYEYIFWHAFQEIYGIHFDLTNILPEFISLLRLLKEFKIVVFKTSPIDTLDLLKRKDNKWRFFFPLDGTDNIVEKIRLMIWFNLMGFNLDNIEWVAGSIHLKKFKSSPLMFVIKNSEIHYVLTDYLDALILMHRWEYVEDLNRYSRVNGLVSIKSLNETFSQEKADYAIKFHNVLTGKINRDFKSLSHPFKSSKIDKKLIDMTESVRSYVQTANLDNFISIDFTNLTTISSADRKGLSDYYNRKEIYSLLAKLKSLEYNENFNSLMEQIYEFSNVGEIRSEFHKLKDILSNFETAELEYIIKNERFNEIFGDKIIEMLG